MKQQLCPCVLFPLITLLVVIKGFTEAGITARYEIVCTSVYNQMHLLSCVLTGLGIFMNFKNGILFFILGTSTYFLALCSNVPTYKNKGGHLQSL